MAEMAAKEKKKREKPRWGTLSTALWFLKRGWRTKKRVPLLIAAMVILRIARSLFELFLPPVTVEKAAGGAPLPDLFAAVGILAGGLLLTNAVLRYIQNNMLFPKIGIRGKIVSDIADKMATTSFPNAVLDTGFERLRSRASNAVGGNSQPGEATWGTLEELAVSLIGFAVYLALLTGAHPLLIGVSAAMSVATFFAGRYGDRWLDRHEDELNAAAHRRNHSIEVPRDPAAAKDIRIFSLQRYFKDRTARDVAVLQRFSAGAEKAHALSDGLNLLFFFLRNGLSYALLTVAAVRGEITVAEFLLYFGAVTGFSSWVSGILSGISTLRRQCVELSAVREFLAYPEPFPLAGGKPIPEEAKKHAELAFEHVSFRYPEAEEDTLHDLSFTLRAGEKLAVVGLNGAGKTTLVRLLAGLLAPTEGRVTLNGEDIRVYDRREYYGIIAAVFQDVKPLSVTLAENVAPQVGKIDRERVTACLEKAGLAPLAEKLPKGIDTPLTKLVWLDGVELSGGEMQRLMLARALYKGGSVLVLDEPTAALDPIAESEMYKRYDEMTEGRAALYISHRLASTRFCDRILFLEKGVIAEEGDHESLMAKGGKYAALFAVQKKYYEEGETA
ncbi:MAG: ABC transporter ATP-binding protein [Clostridia bacterium]|nr:ABC transporter ATP-binding protein [Clostridia bacterium]